MKRIGIYGGTFNPIHFAHLIIAEAALCEYQLDKIIFLTSGIPPHKINLKIIDSKIRHEMVNAAISNNDNFISDDYEINRRDYSYTSNTLLHYNEIYKDSEIFFIIGGDSLKQFSTWNKPEQISHLSHLLVYPRFGEALEQSLAEYKKNYSGKIDIIHSPYFNISSSLIRQKAKENKSIRYLVPESVRKIILEKELYKND